MTSIEIPASVSYIGDGAFSGCSGLTSVTFEEKSKLKTIGTFVFEGCSSLTSVEIPDGVTSIGQGAFSGCSGLTTITIPDSVTSIGKEAFSHCSSLTSIVFGGTKAQWEYGMFPMYYEWRDSVPINCIVYCKDGNLYNYGYEI